MVDGELCSVTDEEEHNDDELDEVEVIQGDDGEHAIFKAIIERMLLAPEKPTNTQRYALFRTRCIIAKKNQLSETDRLIEMQRNVLIESGPHVEKRQTYAITRRHVKFGPSKKGGAKKLKALGDASSVVQQSSLLLFGHGFGLKLPISAASLSQQLKEALGMIDGVPPPWLINMQRYDPPLSYPHLKILGLNALLKHKHWGDLREEKEEKELEDGIQSVDTLLALLLAMRHLKMLLTFERERNLIGFLYIK
ncbi:hypothetical protein QYF36_002449 [Acer negundo]|nr:hypothetical protein QYF36_002449 [Acer negundo]